MKKKILVLLITGFFMCFGVVVAQENELVELVIEPDFHHLGDDYAPTFVEPSPEGTYWETSFWLDGKMLKQAKDAHIESFILANDWANVLINGRSIALPHNPANHRLVFLLENKIGKELVSIPLGYLQEGWNSIAFESTARRYGDHDDMEFGDVVLALTVEKPKK